MKTAAALRRMRIISVAEAVSFLVLLVFGSLLSRITDVNLVTPLGMIHGVLFVGLRGGAAPRPGSGPAGPRAGSACSCCTPCCRPAASSATGGCRRDEEQAAADVAAPVESAVGA